MRLDPGANLECKGIREGEALWILFDIAQRRMDDVHQAHAAGVRLGQKIIGTILNRRLSILGRIETTDHKNEPFPEFFSDLSDQANTIAPGMNNIQENNVLALVFKDV